MVFVYLVFTFPFAFVYCFVIIIEETFFVRDERRLLIFESDPGV